MSKTPYPSNLLEAIRYFSDQDVCTEFVAKLRWPDGKPVCPRCDGTEHSYLTTRRLWKCKACKRQFSVKVGTIFESSPIGLDKWLAAIWLVANSKNGISSHEMGRSLGVTQKTAWFMLHRIRLAMQTGTFQRFGGPVEVDETFIGGKARNMHADVRKRKITGTGGKDKAVVVGTLQRSEQSVSRVQATVAQDRTRRTLHAHVRDHVERGANIYTDSHVGYAGLDEEYGHAMVDNAECYVREQVHTNGIENFWSLLKRGLHGTYVSVQPFHLFRYLDERVFTFNTRDLTDFGRFALLLRQISGRRLSYASLIGKTA